jgi:DNA-binding SARP family transcriptional activator
MELRILGPVEVVVDGETVPLRRPQQRAVLAYLVLHRGQVVSTDRLIDVLWGERPPPNARAGLQNVIAQLRRLLGAAAIVGRPPGYVLDVDAEETDVGRFARLVAEARATDDPRERGNRLRAALALWRGPPLDGPEFDNVSQSELPPLLLDRLGAQQDLVDVELALGRHAESLGAIEALVAEHEFDERLRAQLALALYVAGRQADALDSLRQAQLLFRDELGLELSPALRELERRILVHDVAEPPAPVEPIPPARKPVSVLSAGLVETDEPRDPEALAALEARLAAEAAAVAARHGGVVRRMPGGGVVAVFGLPAAHEDDALRAVRAADALRADVAGPLRIGVESGEVFTHDEGSFTGAPLTGARRLEQLARPGEILLGPAALRLAAGAVEATPLQGSGRGRHQPPAAFRLLAIDPGAPAIARNLDAPLVNREAELEELLDAFEDVRERRRGRLVVLVGDAGIGKTRLAGELAARVAGEATVLVGRCASYGEGATYAPVAEMLSASGGDLRAVLADAGSSGEEHLALRRHFEALARARPLVLVLDDAHWAEPTLLDLLEYLREHVTSAPLLVVCLARPELRDARPGWPALELAPLERRHTLDLLDALERNGGGGGALHARIADAAEGNPLYAEQLLAHAAEGGALDSVPPSLERLLASRLDRLGPEPRGLLQRAAVIGREFSHAALHALSPGEVEPQLVELAGRGFVRPADAASSRFDHVLIRDTAYASLPKAGRAELHERLADWLVDGADELVGYHLEQAYRCRAEIGAVDAEARVVAGRAGERLGRAGLQARRRGDTHAALNLLERAAALLPERASLRLELLCELGIAQRGAGRIGAAAETLAEAAEGGVFTGDRRIELRARLELANVRIFSDPGGRTDGLLAVARDAIPVFDAAGDDRSLSRAWRLIAYVEGSMRCRFGPATEAAERALDHCVRAGWSTAACLGDLAAALHYGPTPVEAAVARSRSLLEDADPSGEASVLAFLAGLEAMRGRFREARRLVGRAEALYDDLGETALAQTNCGTVRGQIELLAGRPAAAARALRSSYEALASMGDRAYLATRAAELAEAVYRGGGRDEAWSLTETAEATGGADDVPTQVMWRGVRLKLLALDGLAAEAEELGREAVAYAETTDSPNLRGGIQLDLAEARAGSGRDADAAVAAAVALEHFAAKGNTVAVDRARALLGS